jgi:glycosyltransferase involved in cell wall biosynthesis/GT2 family glycosyltransferase
MAGTGAIAQSHGVDVVIPVYGAAAELDRCLDSVLRHSPMPPHGLIVVVDGPQGPAVNHVLDRRLGQASEEVQIYRNRLRRGFVASVNRGIMLSNRDLILLNSDTQVTARWIEKLQAAAYSVPKVATVTPLSNSATICSLPEFLEDNFLPAGFTVDATAEIVERTSTRTYPRLPTGVGVCLYIRREALEVVGLFDEERFGLGYGEENEFCMRAERAGFAHLADDATFIYHAGHASFGSDAGRRERAAVRRLRSIEPAYIPRIADFIERDPLRPVRERVIQSLLLRSPFPAASHDPPLLSVLHVVHGWPPFAYGGTEHYARTLALDQVNRHRVAVFARIADRDRATGQRLAFFDHGVRVRFVVNNFDRRNPIARNALKDGVFEKELARFLEQTRPDLVHIHHLSGFCASLASVVAQRRIPIIFQLQDWWTLCARANLWHSDDVLCPGPSASRCAACMPMTGLRPRGALNRMLHLTRRRYLAGQLQRASAYIMGSRAVLDWHRRAGVLNPRATVHVLDYGVPGISRERDRQAPPGGHRRPITFGFIGALMPHKGPLVAAEAFRGVDPSKARLDIWGDPDAQPENSARLAAAAQSGPITLKGRFEEDEKGTVLTSLDVLIVPSVGLESFCIVAREAMAAGVPVLASRLGALEEVGLDEGYGATFTPGDASELRGWIDRIVGDPAILDGWRSRLPEPTTVEAHAAAIDDVYRQVLDGKP